MTPNNLAPKFNAVLGTKPNGETVELARSEGAFMKKVKEQVAEEVVKEVLKTVIEKTFFG